MQLTPETVPAPIKRLHDMTSRTVRWLRTIAPSFLEEASETTTSLLSLVSSDSPPARATSDQTTTSLYRRKWRATRAGRLGEARPRGTNPTESESAGTAPEAASEGANAAPAPTCPKTPRRLRRTQRAMLVAGEGSSPDKGQSTPPAKSDTPAKAKSPVGKEKPKAGAASGSGTPSGAATHKSDKNSRRDGRRPPHKEDQEIIFDWRNNAVTTLRRSLLSGDPWTRTSHLPPGMPQRFCRVRFTPRAAWNGEKQHGGYIFLCMSCITFIAEDSSTLNRIGLYDMMPCSGGEVMCQGPRWTGSVRGGNGVTRWFETPPDATNDTTRILKVPYYENTPSVTTNETPATGRWTCPTTAWGSPPPLLPFPDELTTGRRFSLRDSTNHQ